MKIKRGQARLVEAMVTIAFFGIFIILLSQMQGIPSTIQSKVESFPITASNILKDLLESGSLDQVLNQSDPAEALAKVISVMLPPGYYAKVIVDKYGYIGQEFIEWETYETTTVYGVSNISYTDSSEAVYVYTVPGTEPNSTIVYVIKIIIFKV